MTPARSPFRFRSVVSRWAEVYRVKSYELPTRVKEVMARFVRVLVSDEHETHSHIAEATVMRLPQRLTIRFKILIVTATLLLIFALTNFFSIRLSKCVVNELDTITDYFMLF